MLGFFDLLQLLIMNPYDPKDLLDVYVYKFKSQNQLMLLAYEFDSETRMLLLLGSHENFYRELKR
jgi:mRNA interferase RelE/StbE